MKRLIALLSIFAILVGAGMAYGQEQIDGHVFYHNNPEYPIPEVMVELHDADGNLVETALTDDDGFYAFEELAFGEYHLQFSTNLEPAAVTMEDALNILFYLNGLIEFDAYQLMAADVNADGKVNMKDFLFIVVNHLVFGNPFPAGEWQFEELYVELGARSSGSGNTSGGSGTGDTDGIWLPTGRDLIEALELRPDGILSAQEGEEINFSLKLENAFDINGYLMVLDYDETLFAPVQVTPVMDDVSVSIEEGQIRFSWVNTEPGQTVHLPEVMATFAFMVLHADENHSGPAVKLNPKSHLVDGSGAITTFADILAPDVKLKAFDVADEISISPNPAADYIQIASDRLNGKTVDVRLYSTSGQLLRSWQHTHTAGTEAMYIGDLKAGIYHLVVTDASKKDVFRKRLLIH